MDNQLIRKLERITNREMQDRITDSTKIDILSNFTDIYEILGQYSEDERNRLGTTFKIVADWLKSQPAGNYIFPVDDFFLGEKHINVLNKERISHFTKVFGEDPEYWLLKSEKGNGISMKSTSGIEFGVGEINDEYKKHPKLFLRIERTPFDVLLNKIVKESTEIDQFAKDTLGFDDEDLTDKVFLNMREHTGEGVQAKYVTQILESLGGTVYPYNHFSNPDMPYDAKFLLNDLVESYGYSAYKDTGIQGYDPEELKQTEHILMSMIPMKLANNTFVSKENHDILKNIISSEFTKIDGGEKLLELPRVNSRGGPHKLLCEHIKLECSSYSDDSGIQIYHSTGNSMGDTLIGYIPLSSFSLMNPVGWSKYIDCVCDAVTVGNNKNKVESLFAGIPTITAGLDIFSLSYSKLNHAVNPQFMVDKILKENGMLYQMKDIKDNPNQVLKKRSWEEKMAEREKFLDMRQQLLQEVYNSPEFELSKSRRLDESFREIISGD